jgi:hypothetical protein
LILLFRVLYKPFSFVVSEKVGWRALAFGNFFRT